MSKFLRHKRNTDYIKRYAIECLDTGKIESDCLEYKKSHLQKDAILKTMCAFSNNLMNRNLNLILLGVEEHHEDNLKATPILPIKGFLESEIETVENSVRSLISFIKPKINFDVTHASLGGRSFVILAFSNNNNGPYEVIEKAEKDKTIGLKRGRYVRIERDTRLASVFEEFNLLKKFANYHFTEEFSNVASLDDLDVDYIREYLALTTDRGNTNVLAKYEMAQNMGLIDTTTNRAKNYSILMFSRTPEAFIPYSFVELIYRSNLGESLMQSKEYRGPIWKQLKNVMDDIKNNYIRSITIRVKDEVKSETIYNFPYSTVEELVTNAIVHKNYENPRTIQIYVYDKSIVITNYNKPIPPVTIKDLNEQEAFPNRSYENPSIREMFKSLDYIESYGSGIGKAKRAMSKNGSEKIHFEEYDENIEITSVTIPVNSTFEKYRKLDIEAGDLDIDSQNLDIQGRNLDIDSQNLDIGAYKTSTGAKVKINTIDCVGTIEDSDYSSGIKSILLSIYNRFFDSIFGRKEIVDYLKTSNATGTNYINYLANIGVIEPIRGLGKGKYKFK